MTRQTFSLALTLAVAAAGWLLVHRLVMHGSWNEVYRGVAAVVIGFAVAHMLGVWLERRKRYVDKHRHDHDSQH